MRVVWSPLFLVHVTILYMTFLLPSPKLNANLLQQPDKTGSPPVSSSHHTHSYATNQPTN